MSAIFLIGSVVLFIIMMIIEAMTTDDFGRDIKYKKMVEEELKEKREENIKELSEYYMVYYMNKKGQEIGIKKRRF